VARAVKLGATTQTAIVGGAPPAVGQRLVAPPGLFDMVSWRDAAVAWLAQRLVLLVLSYLELWTITAKGPTVGQWLDIWARWDGDIYVSIAQGGYSTLFQAAYFPMYPLLERVLAPLMGGNPLVAGLFISNAACLVAYALLRVLVEREYDREIARRTLLYLVIFPYAFFLVAAYTEALFLALCLGTFLALRGHRWKLAGVLAALATITRPVGILLLVPMVYEYGSSWYRSAGEKYLQLKAGDILALALPLLALVGFDLVLAQHYGILVPASAAESHLWGRRLSWPWEGILWAGSSVLQGPFIVGLFIAMDIAWALVLMPLSLATLWPYGSLRFRAGSWRRLPLAYGLYTVANALLILATPLNGHNQYALDSIERYMLVVFPLFLLIALWGEPWLQHLIVALSVMLSLFLAVAFIGGAFVG
jgi:hypothetical protein